MRSSSISHSARAALAALGLVTLCVGARPGAAQTTTPAAAGSASSSLSTTDQAYFRKDAQGSVYDLTLAQLGVLRGATPSVRRYASMVVTDHARLNVMMLDLANRERLTDLPLTLAPEDNTRLQRLMGLTGAEFDRAFAEEEVRINAEDVSDAQKELGVTKSAAVRRVVQQFHRTEQKHLAGARALASA